MSEEKPKKERKKKDPAPADGHSAPKRGGDSRERKPNWKEDMATVEDIQNFLMDSSYPPFLRHASWPTESRFL